MRIYNSSEILWDEVEVVYAEKTSNTINKNASC